jgi:hypothetical protein
MHRFTSASASSAVSSGPSTITSSWICSPPGQSHITMKSAGDRKDLCRVLATH